MLVTHSNICFLVILFFLAPVSAWAECLLNVDVHKNNKASYKERDNRCEGVYIRPVSASTKPILRGFHLEPPKYTLDTESLEVQIVGFRKENLGHGLLRAKSMRPRHYYQMDTNAIQSAGVFSWNTEILKHDDVKLSPKELAVLFCENGCEKENIPRVWPVWIKQDGTVPRADGVSPYVILESEVELSRIHFSIKNIDKGTYVYNDTIPRKSFPADYAIKLPLRAKEPGDYLVVVKVISKEGASDLLQFIAVIPPQMFLTKGE